MRNCKIEFVSRNWNDWITLLMLSGEVVILKKKTLIVLFLNFLPLAETATPCCTNPESPLSPMVVKRRKLFIPKKYPAIPPLFLFLSVAQELLATTRQEFKLLDWDSSDINNVSNEIRNDIELCSLILFPELVMNGVTTWDSA